MALKSHTKLTSTVCVLLKLTIGLKVIAIPALFFDFFTYSNLPPDASVYDVMHTSDMLVGIVGLVQVMLAIVTGIAFLRWVYVTNKGLRKLAGDFISFTPGWSVGWFFVPIANIWKPYQVMKELWVASHKGDAVDVDIVGWWWALFLVSGAVGRLSFRLTMGADDAGSYATSVLAQIATDGIGLGLSIVALMMVAGVGKAHSENFSDEEAIW